MRRILIHLRRRLKKTRLVRPWALAAPVLVLVISLPLLRPLRHPDPRSVSDDELARIATVQAMGEHGTLAIDQAAPFNETQRKFQSNGRWYSDQPPTMSVLLSGAYHIMLRCGLTLGRDTEQVIYLLTMLGVAIPAACAAALVYRMGRLFELARPWRALLAATAVLGTGMISYATVLNPHVPAATLVLASAACLIHVTIARKPVVTWIWLTIAGLCAALATTIDPTAVPFLALFLCVIPAMKWGRWRRAAGMFAYVLGAAGPIMLHLLLTVPVTGNFWQGFWPRPDAPVAAVEPLVIDEVGPLPLPAEEAPTGLWASIESTIGGILGALLGGHGVLSHFPILILGILGVTMVMHRHWPGSAKVLASATLAGAALLVIVYALLQTDPQTWRDAMYAARWFIVFGPLVLFWAGAWLRRSHRLVSWVLAGILLMFSVTASIVGATGPWPRTGFEGYTAARALDRLVNPATVPPATDAVEVLTVRRTRKP